MTIVVTWEAAWSVGKYVLTFGAGAVVGAALATWFIFKDWRMLG